MEFFKKRHTLLSIHTYVGWKFINYHITTGIRYQYLVQVVWCSEFSSYCITISLCRGENYHKDKKGNKKANVFRYTVCNNVLSEQEGQYCMHFYDTTTTHCTR